MSIELSLDSFDEAEQQPEKHVSHSQISAYTRCPMIVYWRYVKGIKCPPASAMSFGSSIHKALEHNFSQKIYSKKDVPVDVVTDVFRDTWTKLAVDSVFDAEKDEKPDEMLDEGIMMVRKYHVEVSPNIQPKAVETRFNLTIPGVSREVLGFIDLIDEKEVIIDHKTSKMTPQALTLAKDPQLTLYKMAYRAKHGHNPGGLRYDYMVRKSSKRTGKWVEIHPMTVERNEVHEMNLVATFQTVVGQIALAQFYPNPGTFICTPMGCGFWSRCMGRILAGERPEFLDEIRCMQQDAQKKFLENGGFCGRR